MEKRCGHVQTNGAQLEAQTSNTDAVEEAELPQTGMQAADLLRDASKLAISVTPLVIAVKVQAE